jgi:hypothetical protein
MYASLLGISGALHLDVFDQPAGAFFLIPCETDKSNTKYVRGMEEER